MYTNNPPSGAFRGFGVTQSAFAVEQNMDLLAEMIGMDPMDFRLKNAQKVGETTATGQLLRESVGLLQTIEHVNHDMRGGDPRRSAGAGATVTRRMAGGSRAHTKTRDSAAARRIAR